MVSFMFWKDLSAHGKWIVVGCQDGIARPNTGLISNQMVVGEGEASGLMPPVLVWALEDTVALHRGGEIKRRSWFGWRGGEMTGAIDH